MQLNINTLLEDYSKKNIFKYWRKVKVSGHVQEVLEIAKNCP